MGIRAARPSDFERVIAVLDDWWGEGRCDRCCRGFGFEAELVAGYDGPGADRVTFVKRL